MLKKTPLTNKKKIKVTFEMPPECGASTVTVVGDFNNWDKAATPMKKRKKDGVFATALTLTAGEVYQFRYWLDGSHWENDWAADDYVPNGYGEDNSVVKT
jgi:1,4-alpha-glucan branching enzyme